LPTHYCLSLMCCHAYPLDAKNVRNFASWKIKIYAYQLTTNFSFLDTSSSTCTSLAPFLDQIGLRHCKRYSGSRIVRGCGRSGVAVDLTARRTRRSKYRWSWPDLPGVRWLCRSQRSHWLATCDVATQEPTFTWSTSSPSFINMRITCTPRELDLSCARKPDTAIVESLTIMGDC